MDVLRLRTMARKSTFHFGKFRDISVQQVINSDRTWYLVAVYYNMGNMSYQDDILDELGICGELKIEKPGSNPDVFDAWKVNRVDDRTDLQRIKAALTENV